jgi:hypothetical protein
MKNKINFPVKYFTEQNMAIFLALAGLYAWTIISLVSEGMPMGGDSFMHYKLARYSFQNPELLLNLWGKPVYTLLAAPLSQFGYQGAKLFSLFCGVLAAWFTYLVAKKLNLSFRPLVIILVLFIPYYTILMTSAMTEVPFSLFIILSVFLVLDKKPIGAAVLVSFIPLVRSEGYAIIFAILVVLILNKYWKAIPFLFSGTLIYSIIGWFHFGDFWWIFTQSPYNPQGVEYYGTGDFFFYINRSPEIFGLPVYYGIIAGTLVFLGKYIYVFIKNKENRITALTEFILIPGIFFGYIFMQSFMWYKGIMGVLGSPRFLASVVPLGALLAISTFEIIPRKWAAKPLLIVIVIGLLGYYVIDTSHKQLLFPFRPTPAQRISNQVADYLKAHKQPRQKIWYSDPIYFLLLDMDPYEYFDSELFDIPGPAHEFQAIPGDYLIWDQQFSPNELRLSVERLLNSDQWKLIKEYHPDYPFKTLGDKYYRVMLFQRTEPADDNQAFMQAWDSLASQFNLSRRDVTILKYLNYEGEFIDKFKDNIIAEPDGNQLVKLDEKLPYFRLLEDPYGHALDAKPGTFYLYTDIRRKKENNEETELKLIVTTRDGDLTTNYFVIDLSDQIPEPGRESSIRAEYDFNIPYLPEREILRIYLWKVKGSDLLLDNVIFAIKPIIE